MDKAPIKLSVTCMAYNHEAYIRDALEGFVSQRTDFPFEVLISDDASTDGTAAIIREYAEKYPDIIRPFGRLLDRPHKAPAPGGLSGRPPGLLRLCAQQPWGLYRLRAGS